METMTVPADELTVSMEMVTKGQYENMVASRDFQKERIANLERQVDNFYNTLLEDVEEKSIDFDTALAYAQCFGMSLNKEIAGTCTITYSFVATVPANYSVSDLDFSGAYELESNDPDVEIIDCSVDSQEIDEC